jgi:hypothetical protein
MVWERVDVGDPELLNVCANSSVAEADAERHRATHPWAVVEVEVREVVG